LYRGFYYLKKLFNTSSHITIDDFSSLRINGPYELQTLGPDSATIYSGDYMVKAAGEDLIVETLAEDVAIFTFTKITSLIIKTHVSEEKNYDS